MSDAIVQLRVPYKQDFIPLGRRKSKSVEFWSELPIEIRRVAPEEAPPAYRIVATDEQASPEPYLVRSFDGSTWWPIVDTEELVSLSEFAGLAGVGHAAVIEKLGVDGGYPCRQSPEQFYSDNPYKEIVSCTRDQQWARALRGAAERLIVCGDNVLVAAGEPIYFVVPPWPRERYKIVVGTSSLDRDPEIRGLFTTARCERESSASHGLAFGIEEIDDAIARLEDRQSDGYESRIEPLLPRLRRDAAVLHCLHAFIGLLWGNAQLDHPRSRSLQKNLPCLAGRDLDNIRRTSQRGVLEQLISMSDHAGREEFSFEIARAGQLLRRLDALSSPLLAAEDEAALSRL